MSDDNKPKALVQRREKLFAQVRSDVLAYLEAESELWHNGEAAASNLELREFLGLTVAEYVLYLVRPDLMLGVLPAIPNPADQTIRYLSKPVAVDAVRWFAMGDHPAVVLAQKASCNGVIIGPGRGVLGYDLAVPAARTLLGWREVAPGSWVVTDAKGDVTVWTHDAFLAAFDRVGGITHES